jgi:hypothetical protein
MDNRRDDDLQFEIFMRAIVAAIVWNKVGPGATQEEYESNIVRSVVTADRIIVETRLSQGEIV